MTTERRNGRLRPSKKSCQARLDFIGVGLAGRCAPRHARLERELDNTLVDAGGFDFTDAGGRFDEEERLLQQIADLLSFPVALFHGKRATTATGGGPTASESAAILAAFSRIHDPDARRRCLALVEGCAVA